MGRMVPHPVDDLIQQLRQRVARYPRERYPVQRATAEFHLGTRLIQSGRSGEAVEVLRGSVAGFDARHLPVEHAKALNMLGVALREHGRLEEAGRVFAESARTFAAADQPLEEAAAHFNRGLVARGNGQVPTAVTCFRRALTLFDGGRSAAQAAAAARELGATLLESGDPTAAAEVSQRALDAASAAQDQAGVGAAANVLGLAQLAAGRPAQAADAFATAVNADPRGVRPEAFAMAQANLALAYERLDEPPRARLAARHALGVRTAPPAVTAQARAVLQRLGAVTDDLFVVLAAEPAERWVPLVRAEVVRWADAAAEERREAARQWVAGQLGADEGGPLVEAWLNALLQVVPAVTETVVHDTLAAVSERSEEEQDRFRREVAAGLRCFNVPQWMRLEGLFDRAARQVGIEPWGDRP